MSRPAIPSATFQTEKFADAYQEMLPLLRAHYREIAHYQDIELKPDAVRYEQLCDSGVFKMFTARCSETGALIGYQCFLIMKNLHYSDSVQAMEDVLFISPHRRGFGVKFLRYADDELRKMGVQVIYRHVKKAHNHGRLLERDGYENIDLIFGKRLDK